ncbi:hypothetical protein ABPG77_000682 [Micractinium sp. CCAP 211/92]
MRYDASGSATASPTDIAALEQQICNSTRAAAKQLYQMVEAGGTLAQVASAALLKADSDCGNAASKAYDFALSTVDSNDPADLPATREWFIKFADASDAVGIPTCITLVIVDPTAEVVLWTETIHTGSQL